MARKLKRKFIGKFGVDSGQVLIIDPCYIGAKGFTKKDYKKCCELSQSKRQGGTLNYKLGHPGLGVVSRTGWGDGVYNVWARVDKHGSIRELSIKFF